MLVIGFAFFFKKKNNKWKEKKISNTVEHSWSQIRFTVYTAKIANLDLIKTQEKKKT